jgi:hypothetical protein
MTRTSLRYKNLDTQNNNHGIHSFEVLDMIRQETTEAFGNVVTFETRIKRQIEENHNLYQEIRSEMSELGHNKRKKNKTMDIQRIALMHKAQYNAIAMDYFLYLVNMDYKPFFGITKTEDAEANVRTLSRTAEDMLHASGTYKGFQTILWWNGGIEAKERAVGMFTPYQDDTYWREDLGIFFF